MKKQQFLLSVSEHCFTGKHIKNEYERHSWRKSSFFLYKIPPSWWDWSTLRKISLQQTINVLFCSAEISTAYLLTPTGFSLLLIYLISLSLFSLNPFFSSLQSCLFTSAHKTQSLEQDQPEECSLELCQHKGMLIVSIRLSFWESSNRGWSLV